MMENKSRNTHQSDLCAFFKKTTVCLVPIIKLTQLAKAFIRFGLEIILAEISPLTLEQSKKNNSFFPYSPEL